MIPKTEPGMSKKPPNQFHMHNHMNGSAEHPNDVSAAIRASVYPYPPSHSSKLIEFSTEEKSRLNVDLQKYLAPEFTATRSGPGRSTLTYIEGWRIKNLANSLFGFDGWSSTITDVTVDFLDVDADGKVSVGVSVMIRVTLKDGTFHEDLGYGSSENQRSKASSFEKAKKEATTDGLKRALTSFGNVLGTCLYDKNYCRHLSMQKVDKPKFDSKEMYYYPADIQQRQQAHQSGQSSNAAQSSGTNTGQSVSKLAAPKHPSIPVQQPPTDSHGVPSNQSGGPVSKPFRSTSTTLPAQNEISLPQNKTSVKVKVEQEYDEFFGADFDDAKAFQPESPRMSDFDLEMDDMLADDSPLKGKVPMAGSTGYSPSSRELHPFHEQSFSGTNNTYQVCSTSTAIPGTNNTTSAIQKLYLKLYDCTTNAETK
ncbi:DNA repair protein rad52 [Mortierella sp. GBA30]|nr:DNA repair protein rad52 [Mortierella sp. GBA30]